MLLQCEHRLVFNGRPTTVYVSLLEGQLRLKRTEIRSF